MNNLAYKKSNLTMRYLYQARWKTRGIIVHDAILIHVRHCFVFRKLDVNYTLIFKYFHNVIIL